MSCSFFWREYLNLEKPTTSLLVEDRFIAEKERGGRGGEKKHGENIVWAAEAEAEQPGDVSAVVVQKITTKASFTDGNKQ